MKKTGVLGGTFNPIHKQHLYLAECAFIQLKLDRILLIPSGVSYLKAGTDVLPSKIRYEMCALAVRDMPYITLSDIEIKRPGNSYTFETLTELKALYPEDEFHFIVGTDTFFALDTWKEPETIFKHSIITVALRKDGQNIDETMVREKTEEYRKRYNAVIETLTLKVSDLSSSMIRKIAAMEEDLSPYVPERVAEYIKKNGLYR